LCDGGVTGDDRGHLADRRHCGSGPRSKIAAARERAFRAVRKPRSFEVTAVIGIGGVGCSVGVWADLRPHVRPIARRAPWCHLEAQSRPASEKHREPLFGKSRSIRTTPPRDWVDRCLTSGATLKEEETTNAALTTH
jgi:hypothetical protein